MTDCLNINNYMNGIYNMFTVSYYLYKYNLFFYIVYLLLIRRNYIEAIFIIYNLFR